MLWIRVHSRIVCTPHISETSCGAKEPWKVAMKLSGGPRARTGSWRRGGREQRKYMMADRYQTTGLLQATPLSWPPRNAWLGFALDRPQLSHCANYRSATRLIRTSSSVRRQKLTYKINTIRIVTRIINSWWIDEKIRRQKRKCSQIITTNDSRSILCAFV